MKKYYIFSVLYGLVFSLVSVAMAIYSGVISNVAGALFWVLIFAYAYSKRNEILDSKWRKWLFLTLSTLWLFGTLAAVYFIFLK